MYALCMCVFVRMYCASMHVFICNVYVCIFHVCMCMYCVCAYLYVLYMYGTNHIKLNVLRVRNGRTRTRCVPVPTKREQPFSRRVADLTIAKNVHLRSDTYSNTYVSPFHRVIVR